MKEQTIIYRAFLEEYQCIGYGNTAKESLELCESLYLENRINEDADRSFADAWDYYGGQIEICEPGESSLKYNRDNFLDRIEIKKLFFEVYYENNGRWK